MSKSKSTTELSVRLTKLTVAVGTALCERPPAQIRTCSITAYGSYVGCLASKRWLGCGCKIWALGIQKSASFPKRVIRNCVAARIEGCAWFGW